MGGRRRDRRVQEDRPLGLGDVEKGKRDQRKEGDSERLTLKGSHLVHVGSQESYAKWLHFNKLEGLSAEVPPWEKRKRKLNLHSKTCRRGTHDMNTELGAQKLAMRDLLWQ